MPAIIQLALRGLSFFWALLVMALTGNMIAEATAGNPSVVNYALFCSLFAMLVLFYTIPGSFLEAGVFSPLIMGGLELLTALFWFCCAVALSAELDVHSCGSHSYVDSNKITNGTSPGNRAKRCHEAQASTAFLWFGFAGFLATAVLSGLASRGGGPSRKPGGTTVSRV